MDKVMVTILLTIAGIVCSVFIFNTTYAAVNQGSNSLTSISGKMGERLESQIEIAHVATEYDPVTEAWTDTNGDGDEHEIFVWVKNVGNSRILGIERSDIFWGKEGDFQRIPYTTEVTGTRPYWEKDIEGSDNDEEWKSSETLKITIRLDSGNLPSPGTTYFVKVSIPNGISDEEYFSL